MRGDSPSCCDLRGGAPARDQDEDLDLALAEPRGPRGLHAPLGARALGVGVDAFSRPGQVVQLGVPPLPIDLITSISGVSYDEAVVDPETLELSGRTVRVIGLAALLENKRASARPQDLADVDALERRSAKKRRS